MLDPVVELEKRLRHLEIENARQEEEISNLQKGLKSLSGGINRALWMIGGGFLTVIVTWFSTGFAGK